MKDANIDNAAVADAAIYNRALPVQTMVQPGPAHQLSLLESVHHQTAGASCHDEYYTPLLCMA